MEFNVLTEGNSTLEKPAQQEISQLRRDNTILNGIVSASADACWCMEFGEPIDLDAPEREIIRQVFENDPSWRFCNEAMSRLYRLPPGQDINSRPVDEIFPRNQQNEEFILNLIQHNFHVDAAPALDSRYDGVEIYVENDVRAHIHDGMVHRIFGVVRNVSKHRRRESNLKEQIKLISGILAAVPDPVLALSKSGEVLAANPAACDYLGRLPDHLLGQNFRVLMELSSAEAASFDAILMEGQGDPLLLSTGKGASSAGTVEIRVNEMQSGPSGARVIALRRTSELPRDTSVVGGLSA